MESICRIVTDAISPVDVVDIARDPSHGAESIFFGRVRDINLGKKVIAVSYDAFEPLAEKTFRVVCDEARLKWGGDLRIALVHRIGRLDVGDISIGITVRSRHRDEAYLASRYIIEQVKTRVPIWKKEFYENGESDWVRGHALCGHKDHDHHSSGRPVVADGHR